MNNFKKTKISKRALSVGVLLFVIVLLLLFGTAKSQNYTKTLHRQSVFQNSFGNVKIEAKSAIVFDLVKKEALFELNPLAQLPLASITKVMTSILASEKIPKREMNSLTDVFNAALVSSSNNAAQAIASRAEDFMGNENFLDAMNKKAKELKLNQTYFLNPTGLDTSEIVGGAYSSVSDIASLMSYVMRTNPRLFEVTTREEFGGFRNTNTSVESTTQVIISKTGFTDLADGNLVVVFDVGFEHPVVVVVLGSSKEGRFTDVSNLINATFEYLIKNN